MTWLDEEMRRADRAMHPDRVQNLRDMERQRTMADSWWFVAITWIIGIVIVVAIGAGYAALMML